MRDDDPAFGLVMLSELPQVGERLATRISAFARARCLTLRDALALSPAILSAECRLPAAAVARFAADRAGFEAHCHQLVVHLETVRAQVRHPADPHYPAHWRRVADPPPPVVFLYGSDHVLSAPTLTVLSSRAVTAATVTATVRIVQRAASEGFTVVTGGMKSTHRIAAVAARSAGARRAVVLDRGLFATFGVRWNRDPFGFAPGQAGFDSDRSLVLSSFRLNDHAAPRNGRRRDQLMAALADIVIAVNARAGGEIERTCLRALDHGQCVLSWQGENHGLLAAGARAVDESDLRAGLRRFLEQPEG